jgi:hypothetical protein
MDYSKHINERERVELADMGVYLRLIRLDYQCDSDEQLANLISEQFNVDCRTEDIENYERLYRIKEMEDYEKLSRMAEHGNVEHRIE